ncbi:MAG: phage tail sheath C-terminal domain-containing protein [Cetobacterium sp.]
MGLPVSNVVFVSLETPSVSGVPVGVGLIVLKDDTMFGEVAPEMATNTFNLKEIENGYFVRKYKNSSKILSTEYDNDNLLLLKTFFTPFKGGTPSELIVVSIPTKEENLNKISAFIEQTFFNYCTLIGDETLRAEMTNLIVSLGAKDGEVLEPNYQQPMKTAVMLEYKSLIKSQRVVNFTTEYLVMAGNRVVSGEDFLPRVLGCLCGCPLTASLTSGALDEVISSYTHDKPNQSIDDGELIIVGDFNPDTEKEEFIFGRGVNSLVQTIEGIDERFKKIRVLRTIDYLRESEIRGFRRYRGNYNNDYANKRNWCNSVTSFFNQAARAGLLNELYNNRCEIDIEYHKNLIIKAGKDPLKMSLTEIQDWDTGSFVYTKSHVVVLDSMEDLTFTNYIERG